MMPDIIGMIENIRIPSSLPGYRDNFFLIVKKQRAIFGAHSERLTNFLEERD